MINHRGTNVSNSTQYSQFKFTDTFTAQNDLRFAVGFYEDDQIFNYVDLVAGIYKSDWIITNETNFTELVLHSCTDEELAAFYPIRESQKHEFNTKKRQFKCFDHSKLTLSGNWDSEVTQYLFFRVKIKQENCRNSTDDHFCIGSRDFEEKKLDTPS